MNHSLPFISVIIPVYNAEKTIWRTLESVKDQTYQNFEIIVINDGSSDNSLFIVNSFITSFADLEIKLIDKKNAGVSSARNDGLKIAQGTWISLLDSDDEWLPNKLEKQLLIVSSDPSIDFLGANRNGEYRNRFFLKKFSYLTRISSRLLLYKNFFVTPTVIFKKSIIDDVGFYDERQRYGEDGNYWIKICRTKNCVLLNESLVITGAGKPHFGHSGLSSNLVKMATGEFKNLKEGYQLGIISMSEYFFLIIFCSMKFLRRVILWKLGLNHIAKIFLFYIVL
uniref:glycosyltransferase family 2 protein n=1 Tax=Algoriphagus sp. TaxID=1872435 RepID=UPI004048C322